MATRNAAEQAQLLEAQALERQTALALGLTRLIVRIVAAFAGGLLLLCFFVLPDFMPDFIDDESCIDEPMAEPPVEPADEPVVGCCCWAAALPATRASAANARRAFMREPLRCDITAT